MAKPTIIVLRNVAPGKNPKNNNRSRKFMADSRVRDWELDWNPMQFVLTIVFKLASKPRSEIQQSTI